MPFFSIVIPISNPNENYLKLIQSINSQVFPTNEIELILVKEKEENLPYTKFKTQLVKTNHLGANHSRIVGEQAAAGKYIFFIDDDCLLPHNYLLRSWENHLKENPEVDICGGVYSNHQSNWLGSTYNKIIHLWQSESRPTNVNLVGGHLIVKKEVFKTVHFNATIKYGGSETDFCIRAQELNFKLALKSDFSIHHLCKINFSQFVTKAFLQGQAKVKHQSAVPIKKQVKAFLKTLVTPKLIFPICIFLISSRLGQVIGFLKSVKK